MQSYCIIHQFPFVSIAFILQLSGHFMLYIVLNVWLPNFVLLCFSFPSSLIDFHNVDSPCHEFQLKTYSLEKRTRHGRKINNHVMHHRKRNVDIIYSICLSTLTVVYILENGTGLIIIIMRWTNAETIEGIHLHFGVPLFQWGDNIMILRQTMCRRAKLCFMCDDWPCLVLMRMFSSIDLKWLVVYSDQ